jgi:hypothetical protein
MKNKPERFPWIALLLVCLIITGCAPSIRNPKKAKFPIYHPAGLAGVSLQTTHPPDSNSCLVHALDLIGAWVTANSPEKDPFNFTDINSKPCQGTFEADIQPLFSSPNLWYTGALSCRTCHGPDVQVSYARMDLSSYQGIMAGSGRESNDSKGQDILGGGDWQNSPLFKMLNGGSMPPNKPAGLDSNGPLVRAGSAR